jgi:hypothetical protein
MKKYLILVFASALFLGGCVVEAVETVPEESVEVRTDPPFEGAVWINVEYNWSGDRYVVVPGHWERPRGEWIRGHWSHTEKGYYWERGHWK